MSVVLVITAEWKLRGLLRMGAQIAHARGEELQVILLYGRNVGETSFEVLAAEEVSELVANVPPIVIPVESTKEAGDQQPAVKFHRHAGKVRVEKLIEYISVLAPSILVLGKFEAARDEGVSTSSISRELFVHAPWLSILVRMNSSGDLAFQRILVPASGGPHAVEALRVAAELTRSVEDRAQVTGLFIEPIAAGELANDVGEKILQRVIKKAGLEDEPFLKRKIVLANSPVKGIVQELEEGQYDLLLLGASNTGAVRRTLFGTVPDRLMSGDHPLSLAVVRSKAPIARRVKRFFENWLDLTVPQLDREERVSLFQMLQSGSSWGFDFMALITLSTLLASIGLIQNSTAVVIGAMLVAPLMMPLIGAGLALVQGNAPLMKDASRAIGYGFLLALLSAWVLGTLVPGVELTDELLARGGPTLLDMAVGFLSGLAAAHCLARPGLSAALPGVAIAAALVPPIATVGISVGLGAMANARGAALLFSTNVIAIILGASFCLYAAGLRGKQTSGSAPVWVYGVTLGLLLSAAVLTVPLGLVLVSGVASSGNPAAGRPEKVVTALVKPFINKKAGRKLLRVTVSSASSEGEIVEITYRTQAPPGKRFSKNISRLLSPHFSNSTRVRLIPEFMFESKIQP
jgi:uncharacterized hydrophobic protein (TIGR00271 family)